MDRLTSRSPATLGLAALVLVAGTATVTARVTGERDEPAPAPDQGASLAVDTRAAFCPDSDEDPLETRVRGVGGETYLTAVLVDREPTWSDEYCLRLQPFDAGGPRPVRVTLSAPADAKNYGESHTFLDTEGSDELMNFPVFLGVNGGCRPVVATIELRNGETRSARLRIGHRCGTDD